MTKYTISVNCVMSCTDDTSERYCLPYYEICFEWSTKKLNSHAKDDNKWKNGLYYA